MTPQNPESDLARELRSFDMFDIAGTLVFTGDWVRWDRKWWVVGKRIQATYLGGHFSEAIVALRRTNWRGKPVQVVVNPKLVVKPSESYMSQYNE